ncbi:WD40/YVTN/BNR-like repeat-containing protein [Roseateles sp. BYS78W]|uniref:WD40/YVTN/BNR-like repeat-containing protein n=1 Tax=Pelomonas candidula TaxID=3299025 RepID=A0ABW7HEX9_9BURK
MRLKLGTLTLALAAGGALPALAQTCTPTAITPYINVNGTWTQTSSATLKTGTSAIFGPQPVSGGSWSWSGCGTAGAAREQTISPSVACTATATYTNSCGARSTQNFTVGVGTWASVKFGGGGYVSGLVFHPMTANLLYARTDIGGAYRWNQGTSSWTPITDGLGFGAAESSYHGIESIAVDPNNDQLVYMAAGMYNSDKADARLYISSNRGDSWTYVNLPFSTGGNNGGRAIGERLMVDPNKPSTLFYGSRTAGLWKSTDSGRTWAQVTSLSSTKMTAAQISAVGSAMGVELVVYDTGTKGTGAATQTIYTAIAPDYASVSGLTATLYKSTNGGASWSAITPPVSGYHIPHMVRAADGVFYVVFTKDAGPGAGGPGRLYKFDGTNWTLLKSEDPNGGTNFGLGGVSVSGTGATTRIALGVTNSWGNYSGQQIVQLSDDGGRTWREIEAQTPGVTASGWVDDVEIDPANRDHILHVHGGGVIETRNASSATPTWSASVTGIEETATQSIATPPAGASYLFVNSAGDVGTWVDTNLTTAPTLGPGLGWSNGIFADMAWSDPTYIAGSGVVNSTGVGTGYWSGDAGKTWATFASLPAGATSNTSGESSIAVTARNNFVWAPANSVPSYTMNNGASWTATNLPALAAVGWNRGYRLAADRRNSNKVYAYDSGGAWWASAGKVYVSNDGGHSFALSQGSVSANLAPNGWWVTSMAVNPNVEGDIWLADGNALYHSVNSGANWTKLSAFASVYSSNSWPDLQGASMVALGKAKTGSPYSAAIYVVGTINGVWGVYRSDDGGATWARHNDDAHQFGGIGQMAADQNVYGRIYVSGTGRGLLYSN